MARNKSKKLRLLKGEKTMYFIIVLLIALIPVLNVYTSSVLTKTNIEKESLKRNIERQKETNESLSMQIDELASLDNIQKIAEEKGLTYNNNFFVIE